MDWVGAVWGAQCPVSVTLSLTAFAVFQSDSTGNMNLNLNMVVVVIRFPKGFDSDVHFSFLASASPIHVAHSRPPLALSSQVRVHIASQSRVK